MPEPPLVQWKRYTADGGRDAFNRPTSGFLDPVPIDASFAPETTVEPRDGSSQRVVSTAKLYLDDPIDYTARDEFLVDGQAYTAEGVSPGWFGKYTGYSFGQEILLQRVVG